MSPGPPPDTITIGSVSITRVVEWVGGFAPKRGFVPEASDADWETVERLLPVTFFDDDDIWLCAMQSWVLRSMETTVVVDTCFGHHGSQPGVARLGHSADAYLDNLAAAGVDPGEVDIVVNTHLHQDHIGWNTHQVDGAWVPTFPNATYLMTQLDLDYLDPELSPLRALGPGIDPVLQEFKVAYGESIEPLIDRGMVKLWEGSHRIDSDLSLELAPGHTPGSAVVRLESEGSVALFIGDVIHIPVQIVAPDANSSVCLDPAQARRTRRRLLGEAADTDALVVPAHFVGSGAVQVGRDGERFTITNWAALPHL